MGRTRGVRGACGLHPRNLLVSPKKSEGFFPSKCVTYFSSWECNLINFSVRTARNCSLDESYTKVYESRSYNTLWRSATPKRRTYLYLPRGHRTVDNATILRQRLPPSLYGTSPSSSSRWCPIQNMFGQPLLHILCTCPNYTN